MKKPKVFNDTGFVDFPASPGFTTINVDENGNKAGCLNAFGCLFWFAFFPFVIFALVVPLMLLFMVLQQLPIIGPILGVPQ